MCASDRSPDVPPEPPPAPRTLWLAIVLAGVAVGGLSVCFHAALDEALALREQLGEWAKPFGSAGALLLCAVCAAAVGVAVWMTGRFAPQAAGSGIQHVEGVERGLLPLWPLSLLWVKFVGGVLGIGGGLVLGREGPTVQMGSSIAEHIGQRFALPWDARRILLAVGAGAGLAGAFDAPLAGTLFVLEELKCALRPALYLGTLLASLLTDLCVRFYLGPAPELSLASALPPLAALLPVALIGALAGALGVLFNASLLRALAAADRWKQRIPAWAFGAGLGAGLGVVAWFVPALPGGGVTFAASMLDGEVTPSAALWLLPLSIVLTIASYAIGAPGGIFAPLLVIGAALGLVFHGGLHAWLPASAGAMPVFAAAGMAGLFAGIVRSPLTGSLLLIEMTGSYDLVLPLVLASLAAYAVAEALHSPPIYESLLERELRKLG
jgi:CIC family chloride channel protein